MATLKLELNKSILDEKMAPKGYYKLMDKLKSPLDKLAVRDIINDEIRHRRIFEEIKRREV